MLITENMFEYFKAVEAARGPPVKNGKRLLAPVNRCRNCPHPLLLPKSPSVQSPSLANSSSHIFVCPASVSFSFAALRYPTALAGASR